MVADHDTPGGQGCRVQVGLMARAVGRDRGKGGGRVRWMRCDQRVPGLGWFGWNAAGLGTWRWQDGEPDLWPIRLLQDSTANSVKGLARLGNASEIQATGGPATARKN